MTISQPATVSAIREDGRVNLAYRGATVLKVACLDSYTNRQVGDRVGVVYDAGMYTVTGRYGADSAYVGPSQLRQASANFKTTGYQAVDSNQAPQMGTRDATVPLIAGIGYWTGSANTLVVASGPATAISIWVSRLDNDEGRDSGATIGLFPHGHNALPSSGFSYFTSYTVVQLGLERGEVKTIPLPADWVTAIKAGTIRGVCLVPGLTLDPLETYAQFGSTTGGFTAS
jgi:hypothetical protein